MKTHDEIHDMMQNLDVVLEHLNNRISKLEGDVEKLKEEQNEND